MVRFNVRVEQPEDADWTTEQVNAVLEKINAREGYGAKLHGGFGRPPKPMTPQLKAFFEALKGVGAELGINVGWKATGGCCDGNNIAAAGVPVIDTLGVRGAPYTLRTGICKGSTALKSAQNYLLCYCFALRRVTFPILALKIVTARIFNERLPE